MSKQVVIRVAVMRELRVSVEEVLTTEGIDEPVYALNHAREARGVSKALFRTIGFGESVFLR
jgi:hypothetical protein